MYVEDLLYINASKEINSLLKYAAIIIPSPKQNTASKETQLVVKSVDYSTINLSIISVQHPFEST